MLEVSTPRSTAPDPRRRDAAGRLRREMPARLPGCGSCLHRPRERSDPQDPQPRATSISRATATSPSRTSSSRRKASATSGRPTRPLRSLFAPRATRVVRVLLSEPGRAWRLEELAKAAEVSLGHSHNVVKRLEELAWLERDDERAHPARQAGGPAGELVRRPTPIGERDRTSYAAPERITRKFLVEVARVADAEGRRYAFTMNAGAVAGGAASALAGGARATSREIPRRWRAALGLRPVAEADGDAAPPRALRPGVFYGAAREGRAQGRVSASALRGPRALRAPRAGAGRAPPPRGDGLLKLACAATGRR